VKRITEKVECHIGAMMGSHEFWDSDSLQKRAKDTVMAGIY